MLISQDNIRHVTIRLARPDDGPGIRKIMAWFIEQTTSNWRYEVMDQARIDQWLRDHLSKPAHQVWVAESDRQLIGYSCLSDFRAGEGYWPCAENSIYVLPDFAGQGIGSLLMQRILDQARICQLKSVVAAIDGDNRGSIRFHQNFGFKRCGYLRQVGWKNNHWLDLVLMVYAVPALEDPEPQDT